MSVSALLVATFDVVIWIVVALRAHEVLFVWPLDRNAVQVALRAGVAGIVRLGEEGETSAVAMLARAMSTAEPGEHAIAIEDALALLREQLTQRLLWLRVMAPAASGLGLAGAAAQASWARNPPGLLALDPDRVLGMAVSDGATCLALGIAGSTTALGALFFLRRRALTILEDAHRLAERGRSIPAEAWTTLRQ
jgi:hypothetical protein